MVHYRDQSSPPPPLAGLAMEPSSPCLSSFACLTIHMSHTGRQKKMQTCQNHRGKAKRKHTGAERRYQADAAMFKADNPQSFFLFFLPLPGKSSRRTADSHAFSCSRWLLQTFRERFDFNRSK